MKHLIEDIKTSYASAATYFGVIVGPAMASGTFATSYYAKFGANSLWLPWITIAAVGLTIFMGLTFAKTFNCYDFGSFSDKLFGKTKKVLGPFFNVLLVLTGVISMATQIALGASLTSQVLNCSYALGCLLISIVFIGITVFGEKVIRNSNVVMSFLLLIAVGFFMILVVSNKSVELSSIFSNWESWTTWGGLGTGVLLALGYGFANSTTFFPMLSVSNKINTNKRVALSTGFAVVLNYIIILMTILIVLPFAPISITQSTPILYCISQLSSKLAPFYILLMFVAILSSAPAQLFTQTKRWNRYIKVDNEILKSSIVATLVSLPAALLSLLGLETIVSKVMTIMGFISIPAIFFPIVFTTLPRVKKYNESK